MGLIDGIFKTAIDVVKLPLSAVASAVSGEDQFLENLEDLEDDLKDTFNGEFID